MLKDIYTYVNEGTSYYGLEISENLGLLNFHLLEIQRKKQELFVEAVKTSTSLEEAIDQLRKNAPIFLVVNTGQVLTKVADLSESASDEALVHNAFPNLDFDTFYYELTKSKNNLLISICLKANVSSFLNNLNDLEVNVVSFSLGVSSITSVLRFLHDDTISVSNSQLVLQNNAIEKIIPLSNEENKEVLEYEINGIGIQNDFLLGFSSVLKHLTRIDDSYSNFVDRISYLKTEFKNRRHFTLLLRTSLLLILGILLVNFLFFIFYFENVNGLKETLTVNNVNKNQLVKLKQDVRKKEERIQAILSTSNSRSSILIDEIVENMPLSIILSELEYQPLAKPLRDTKQVEVLYNTIILSGQSRESKDYYTWVESLEKLAWVTRVETTDYDYENKNTSNFSLEIEIDEKRN